MYFYSIQAISCAGYVCEWLLFFFSIFEFSELEELTANWSMNIWTQWTITTFQTRSNHYKCLKILIQPPWAQMFRLVYSIFVSWTCRLNGKESILAMPGQQHSRILVGYFCLAQQRTQGTNFIHTKKEQKKSIFRIEFDYSEQNKRTKKKLRIDAQSKLTSEYA